jgi:uncharacterized membrane protein
MIAGMTYYSICMYFLIYSFGGWIVEVIYHAVVQGKIVNRGFLNGPVCPVYGFGMLAVLASGNALSSALSSGDATSMNTFVLFLFGFVLATLVELIAGWLLYKCFHARWWDYSNKPFNVHGYICLEFSIIWGLAIVLVVKVIHPALSNAHVIATPSTNGWWVMAVLYALYLFDFIMTILTASGLNKELKELDHIRKLMRMPSDKLSDFVGTTSLTTAQQIQQGKVQVSLAKAELGDYLESVQEEHDLKNADKKAKRNEATAKYKEQLLKRREEIVQEISTHYVFGKGRLLRAFPDLTHERYDETLRLLKKRVSGLRDIKDKHDEEKND